MERREIGVAEFSQSKQSAFSLRRSFNVSMSKEFYLLVMRGDSDVHKLGRKGAPWFRMVALLSVRHRLCRRDGCMYDLISGLAARRIRKLMVYNVEPTH